MEIGGVAVTTRLRNYMELKHISLFSTLQILDGIISMKFKFQNIYQTQKSVLYAKLVHIVQMKLRK